MPELCLCAPGNPQGTNPGLLAGGARRRLTFFACAKNVSKESTPRFAALRVPKFRAAVRAAAQLAPAGLRHCSPTPPERQHEIWRLRGESSTTRHRCHPAVTAPCATLFRPLCQRRGFCSGSGLPQASERCLSAASSFAAPVQSKNSGVSPEAGRPSFGYFSWPLKKSNALPGAPGQTPFTFL